MSHEGLMMEMKPGAVEATYDHTIRDGNRVMVRGDSMGYPDRVGGGIEVLKIDTHRSVSSRYEIDAVFGRGWIELEGTLSCDRVRHARAQIVHQQIMVDAHPS